MLVVASSKRLHGKAENLKIIGIVASAAVGLGLYTLTVAKAAVTTVGV
jgi:Tfp pilus assembly major pilin PilA